MGGEGEAAGEQEALARVAGELHGGAEQRVIGCGLSGRGQVSGPAWDGGEPVALALEGIGGQRDALGACALEEGSPVELCPCGMGVGDRG